MEKVFVRFIFLCVQWMAWLGLLMAFDESVMTFAAMIHGAKVEIYAFVFIITSAFYIPFIIYLNDKSQAGGE